MRTLGFAFCQPPKKSLPQKKSLQNFKLKKSPQIANFKPKKGLHTSPSLIYLSTPVVLVRRTVALGMRLNKLPRVCYNRGSLKQGSAAIYKFGGKMQDTTEEEN